MQDTPPMSGCWLRLNWPMDNLSGHWIWPFVCFDHFLSRLAPGCFAQNPIFCLDQDQTVSAIAGGPRFPWAVQHVPKAMRPVPYAKDLCPLPSARRPHVLTSECLQLWLPLHGCESTSNAPSSLTPDDIWQIAIVMGKSWEESTLAAYGSGLLNFHVYCDQKGIPEHQCAPTSPVLIHAFISALAASGKWHIALLSLLALVWLTRVLCLDWALHGLTNDLCVWWARQIQM